MSCQLYLSFDGSFGFGLEFDLEIEILVEI